MVSGCHRVSNNDAWARLKGQRIQLRLLYKVERLIDSTRTADIPEKGAWTLVFLVLTKENANDNSQ